MGVTFLAPWVGWLALSVAVPVIIHMLRRERSRELRFPSLRFLSASRVSSIRRRRVHDWPLLALRIGLVLAATVALAGPIFITPARQVVWQARIAREVVLDGQAAPPEDELRSAAVGATFARARVGDAIRDAVRWLVDQRPVAREIVILSSFSRGAVTAADLADLPAGVGVRFVRGGEGTDIRERETVRLELRDEGLVRITERLTLSPRTTELRQTRVEQVASPPIAVTAPPEQEAEAAAALRAVLRRGVRLPPAGLMQPLRVPWPGTVDALAEAIDTRLSAPLDTWEPERMTDAELAGLSRPVSPQGDPAPEDSGDRRIVWALVLVLLVTEAWVRKDAA